MKIIVADDSALLREGIAGLLERQGHTVLARASDANELVAEVAAHAAQVDVAITDVRMPPGMSDDGLIAALRIREQCPRQPVMVLSQHIADTYARELLTLPEGATGYLLKDRINRVRDFAGALETVAAGGTVIDPDVVQRLLSRAPRGPLEALSPREHEVLALMADGRSNTGIASALTLSDAAVSKHIGNIFMKLGLSPVEENRRVKAVLTYLDQQR